MVADVMVELRVFLFVCRIKNNNLLNERCNMRIILSQSQSVLPCRRVANIFLPCLPENRIENDNLLNVNNYNVETIIKGVPYRFTYSIWIYMYVDIRCRKEKRGKEREKTWSTRTGRFYHHD